MLKLEDLFTLLTAGELSNVSLGRDNTGKILESEYPKLIGCINLGLVELCKRFRLLENELLLHVTPDIALYQLRDDNILDQDSGYIELLSGQRGVNIIEVTGIFDAAGSELTMNNRHAKPAVVQAATDTLRFSGLTTAAAYNVVYQAYPDKLVPEDAFRADSCLIPVPDAITEALLAYVTYRIYKTAGVHNSTANVDKSAAYQQQYELACQKIELLGLGIQNCDDEDTFAADGWV